MNRLRSIFSRLRDSQTMKRLHTNPLRLALFLLMLSAWAVVAAAAYAVSFLSFLLVWLAKSIGRAHEWFYNLSNERIYLGLLLLSLFCIGYMVHQAEIRSRPLTYAFSQGQDSTFVADIKQCCARDGWVWADSPEVRKVARQIYEKEASQ